MRKIAALLLLMILLLTACAAPAEQEPPAESVPVEDSTVSQDTAPQEEQTAGGILSSFTATDLDGNAVDQTLLQGKKLTMVNVWATYCGPCVQEMPALGQLAAEYADRGLQILGLVSDAQNADGETVEDQVQLAKDIAAQTGADYLHLIPGTNLNYLLYQITAVPTTFFVDENGVQVGSAYVGAQSYEDWVRTIDQALEEVQ